MQTYGFGHSHGRGNTREMDIPVNTDNITVNAAYISIEVNSKTFTIRSQYGDMALFLHYATIGTLKSRL